VTTQDDLERWWGLPRLPRPLRRPVRPAGVPPAGGRAPAGPAHPGGARERLAGGGDGGGGHPGPPTAAALPGRLGGGCRPGPPAGLRVRDLRWPGGDRRPGREGLPALRRGAVPRGGKGETGLGQEEVRHWPSWSRHRTRSLLAHAWLASIPSQAEAQAGAVLSAWPARRCPRCAGCCRCPLAGAWRGRGGGEPSAGEPGEPPPAPSRAGTIAP